MESLKEAGLTENESKVYLSLINNGPSLAGGIARKSGLHRRTVYDVTETLIKKGLIGYIIKNNRRIFQATNPKRILEIIEEKKANINIIVKSLQEKYSKSIEKEETLFFKGKEGLKSVLEDQLNEREILVIGANKDASEFLPYYFKWYNQKRKKKKIVLKIISSSKKISKIPMSQIKFLPEKYSSPMAINIYGNKTAIIHWSKNPHAVLIKSKDIADGYRKYFELLWKIAKV